MICPLWVGKGARNVQITSSGKLLCHAQPDLTIAKLLRELPPTSRMNTATPCRCG
jgi:hypothetical protein